MRGLLPRKRFIKLRTGPQVTGLFPSVLTFSLSVWVPRVPPVLRTKIPSHNLLHRPQIVSVKMSPGLVKNFMVKSETKQQYLNTLYYSR